MATTRKQLLVALFLVLVAVPLAAKPPHKFKQFEFPRETTHFIFDDATNFDDYQLGFSLRYTIRDAKDRNIDLFVYPIVNSDEAPLTDAVALQHMSLKFGVEEGGRQGHYRDVRTVMEEEHVVAGSSPSLIGIRSRFEYSVGEVPVVSHGFVMANDGYFYKIRNTQHAVFDAAEPEVIEEFAREVLAQVRPRKPRKDLEFTLTIGIGLGSQPQCSIAARLAYGAVQSASIEAQDYLDTHAREFRWHQSLVAMWLPMREEKSEPPDDEPCVDPDMDQLALASTSGFLPEYVWEYFAKPYWRRPDGLRLDEFAAWKADHLAEHKPPAHGGVWVTLKP